LSVISFSITTIVGLLMFWLQWWSGMCVGGLVPEIFSQQIYKLDAAAAAAAAAADADADDDDDDDDDDVIL
jgi:hypothetical protein